MKLPTVTFNPRSWVVGINWDKSTVGDFTCRFLCVHFGPFLWTWNLSDEIEWVTPCKESSLLNWGEHLIQNDKKP